MQTPKIEKVNLGGNAGQKDKNGFNIIPAKATDTSAENYFTRNVACGKNVTAGAFIRKYNWNKDGKSGSGINGNLNISIKGDSVENAEKFVKQILDVVAFMTGENVVDVAYTPKAVAKSDNKPVDKGAVERTKASEAV